MRQHEKASGRALAAHGEVRPEVVRPRAPRCLKRRDPRACRDLRSAPRVMRVIGPGSYDSDRGTRSDDLPEQLQPLRARSRCHASTVPVMFPPGRARLCTSPASTGSPTVAMTMGIVVVACLAAGGRVAPTTITSTCSRTSSEASREAARAAPPPSATRW